MKTNHKWGIVAALVIITVIVAATSYVYYSPDSDTSYYKYQYDALYDEYDDLISDYNLLVNQYNGLTETYGELYAPSTLIKNGIIYWRFNKVDGSVAEWTVDVDAYHSYITWSDPIETRSLKNTGTGETYFVKDLAKYVQPDFFVNVISTLTDEKTDEEFVAEVVNLKNQLVTYDTGLTGEYRWSAETITEGQGNCGDTSILMASLLKAGESKENYGLKVYFWYCDAGNMSDPQSVNHAIVEVEYSDGSNQLIETTSDNFYTYGEITGWKFEV